MTNEIKKKKEDNWQNAINKFGSLSKFNQTCWAAGHLPESSELESMYRYFWLVERVCSVVPEDALKNWIDVNSENESKLNELYELMEVLKIQDKFTEAATWGNLYGGSVILIGADDNQEMSEPLDIDRVSDIKYLTVLDKTQINVLSYYTNALEPKYGEPKIYVIIPITGENVGTQIHESRLIRFDGVKLPDKLMRANAGWGDSIITKIYEQLKGFGVSMQASFDLLQDFISKVLKMKDMTDILSNEDGAEIMVNRLKYLTNRMAIDNIHAVDAEDDFQKIQNPITGFVDLLNLEISVTSAAAGIPKTRLFGEQLGTLSGATETTRDYYSSVERYQTKTLRSKIDYILEILWKVIGGKEDEYTWSFSPVITETDKEKADAREKQANVDEKYINSGVVTPEEIRNSRFTPDGYSFETVVDGDIDMQENELEIAIGENENNTE